MFTKTKALTETKQSTKHKNLNIVSFDKNIKEKLLTELVYHDINIRTEINLDKDRTCQTRFHYLVNR